MCCAAALTLFFRLVDLVVTYHKNEEVQEYDALYENTNF